jgi:hypothetical protein
MILKEKPVFKKIIFEKEEGIAVIRNLDSTIKCNTRL